MDYDATYCQVSVEYFVTAACRRPPAPILVNGDRLLGLPMPGSTSGRTYMYIIVLWWNWLQLAAEWTKKRKTDLL